MEVQRVKGEKNNKFDVIVEILDIDRQCAHRRY